MTYIGYLLFYHIHRVHLGTPTYKILEGAVTGAVLLVDNVMHPWYYLPLPSKRPTNYMLFYTFDMIAAPVFCMNNVGVIIVSRLHYALHATSSRPSNSVVA